MKIHDLPVDIFLILRKYLKENNYLNLLNCNRKSFQQIKYETFRWTIRLSKNSKNADDFNQQMMETIPKLVKNKLTQIKIICSDLMISQLLKNLEAFQNIYKLKIQMDFNERFSNDFDFNVFNHISYIDLSGFRNITTISSGFIGAKEVSLHFFPELVSITIPFIGVNRVSVRHCQSLKDLPTFASSSICLEHIQLENFGALSDQCRSLTLDALVIPIQYLPLSNFSSLEYLYISGLVPLIPPNDDLSCLSHIPKLFLHTAETVSIQPKLLDFQGKQLELGNFDLSDFSSSSRMKYLSLRKCQHVMILEEFNHLIKISLQSMNYPSEIFTSFPNLEKLTLYKVNGLRFIQYQPKLRNLSVTLCDDLFEYQGPPPILPPQLSNDDLEQANEEVSQTRKECYEVFNSVKIDHCHSIKSVSAYRNAHSLTINECYGITSFEGLDQSDLPAKKRSVSLKSLNARRIKFCHLGNIGRLTLEQILHLKDGSGIHDIDHVVVRLCEDLISTKGFLNIRKSITLMNLFSLQSLEGLGSIPKVIWYGRFLVPPSEYVGLTGCKKFYCCDDDKNELERHAIRYSKRERDGEGMEVFRTIEEFYLIDSSRFFQYTNTGNIESSPYLRRLW